jgi:hypothetical protein
MTQTNKNNGNNLKINTMTNLLILSFLLFACYTASVVAANRGIPASLSDGFYILNRLRPDLGYVFTLVCYAVGGAVMAALFEFSEGTRFQFLALFAGGGLCFTGAAPLFKSREKLVHCISAAVCAVSSALWLSFAGYWMLLIPLPLIALLARRNRVFWLELAIFITVYVSLFIIKFNSYANI